MSIRKSVTIHLSPPQKRTWQEAASRLGINMQGLITAAAIDSLTVEELQVVEDPWNHRRAPEAVTQMVRLSDGLCRALRAKDGSPVMPLSSILRRAMTRYIDQEHVRGLFGF